LAWSLDANITAKVEKYTEKFNIEGVLLDQYAANENICPFEKDLNISIDTLYAKLFAKNMKLYLSFKTGIPTKSNCKSFETAKK